MKKRRDQNTAKHTQLMANVNRRAVTALVLLVITVLIAPNLPILPHSAKAQTSSTLPSFVGRLCIVPGESTDCPQTLPNFPGILPLGLPSSQLNFPGALPGSRLNVSINIIGSSNFDSFDIRVQSDPTVRNATSVDSTGTIFPGSLTTACVNGGGTGCVAPLDGPGVVRVVGSGSTATLAPASGRLFKITYLVISNSSAVAIGFGMGCTTVSVPNTNVCLLLTIGGSPVMEGIQSQLLGPQLPTPLASVTPPGNVTGFLSGGSPTQPAVTLVAPYAIAFPGNITIWKVQFHGFQLSSGAITDPMSVQIKVLRKTSSTTLTVVAAGLPHDPRPILRARLPGYPFVLTQSEVIEFSDSGLSVLPGDLIAITYTADPAAGFFAIPLATTNPLPARLVTTDVPVGGTIDLSSPFTGSLECGFPSSVCSPAPCTCWTPALQVFIRVPPPATDTAGDGIPDFVKLSPELRALGADPCRKTVAVQIDYMVASDHTHKPLPEALDMVTSAFDAAPVQVITPCPYAGYPTRTSGVKLIIDVKNPFPEQFALNFTGTDPQSFDTIKAALFDPNRFGYFHYGLFVHDLSPNPPLDISGLAEVYGSNFIVSLGEWTNRVGTAKEQAGTLMHELGHNLGLEHGGGNDINYKPNYLSVMNFAFQVVGITSQTSSGTTTRFDYSSQALPPLIEGSLDERVGISDSNDYTFWTCPDPHMFQIGLGSPSLDWNCDKLIDTSNVSVDINNDTSLETLNGFNDWPNLKYNFRNNPAFIPNFSGGCRTGCPTGTRDKDLRFSRAQAIEAAWAAFLATPRHTTSTTVSCPASVPVNNPSTCTAVVTDTSSGIPATPTGAISFSSSQAGAFTPSTCTLSAGTGSSASCAVSYTPSPSSVGSQTISAFYPGDANHLGSVGSTTITGFLPIMTITASTALTADFTGQIVIGASTIVLDCNGHTISGASTNPTSFPRSGILLNNTAGVTIKNCHVTNFYIGFQTVNSNQTTFTGDSATGDGLGFQLSNSNNNLLSGDTASGNGLDGFLLQSSNNNVVVGDTANGNLGSGFGLVSSWNNNLQTDTANGNGAYGFALTFGSNNNLVAGNAACSNGLFDAFQSGSTQNTFRKNLFCTTSGV